jgi:hypothetical protein
MLSFFNLIYLYRFLSHVVAQPIKLLKKYACLIDSSSKVIWCTIPVKKLLVELEGFNDDNTAKAIQQSSRDDDNGI